jgi:hypothetical protein
MHRNLCNPRWELRLHTGRPLLERQHEYSEKLRFFREFSRHKNREKPNKFDIHPS